ncbi:MAG: class I SAM-dependent RNA methyltransferase, partial [Kiloniellales bacterium]|nr:class I SAM-dependent RNA methyltransferase [Kiloniellales bacterium]
MRRKARKGGGRQLDVTIERIGAKGDGVAACDGQPLFLAGALPGEAVRALVSGKRGGGFKGRILELLETSPERVEPPCPHFGPCGGCSLQHWAPASYRKWKTGLLVTALKHHGLTCEAVSALRVVPPGSRRRIDLSCLRLAERTVVGFHERGSHHIENIDTCHLLTAGLRQSISPLHRIVASCFEEKEKGELV